MSEANEGGGGVLGTRGAQARREFGGTLIGPVNLFHKHFFCWVRVSSSFCEEKESTYLLCREAEAETQTRPPKEAGLPCFY